MPGTMKDETCQYCLYVLLSFCLSYTKYPRYYFVIVFSLWSWVTAPTTSVSPNLLISTVIQPCFYPILLLFTQLTLVTSHLLTSPSTLPSLSQSTSITIPSHQSNFSTMFTRALTTSTFLRSTPNAFNMMNTRMIPTLPKFTNTNHYHHYPNPRRPFSTSTTRLSQQQPPQASAVQSPPPTTTTTPAPNKTTKAQNDLITPPPNHPPIQPPPPEHTNPTQLHPITDQKAKELSESLTQSGDKGAQVVGDLSGFLLRNEFALTLVGVLGAGALAMGLYYDIRDEWARGDAIFWNHLLQPPPHQSWEDSTPELFVKATLTVWSKSIRGPLPLLLVVAWQELIVVRYPIKVLFYNSRSLRISDWRRKTLRKVQYRVGIALWMINPFHSID